MKKIIIISLHLAFSCSLHAQILKKIGNDIKNQAEQKVRSKAAQKVDQGLDSLLTPKTKTEDKKSGKSKKSSPSSNTGASASQSGGDSEGMTMGEGFISLSSSAEEVFRNGTVIFTGNSVKYGSLGKVEFVVKGPGVDDEEELTLNENGSYSKFWQAENSGTFTITVKSSDGKDAKSVTVKVYEMELTDWEEAEDEVDEAHEKLKKEVQRVGGSIGAKDKADLEKKMDAVEEKIKTVKSLYNNLRIAIKELGGLTKKGVALPNSLYDNLSKLNDAMNEQKRKMEAINEATNRQPLDNTICEYLVMLNEACAAFSTITNIWSKSIGTIIKNVMLDKVVPKGVEVGNQKAGSPVPADYDVMAKQPAKLFAAAKFDSESLYGKLSVASFAGDITQFATDFLMKKYCGLFKGELSHDYSITYRNRDGNTWWAYTYKTEAAVTFRYPKSNTGKIIKMKGNIEGNATDFKFFQNVELMDDFRDAMKSRASLKAIPLYKPLSVGVATSQKDDLGFGAVARGVGTPAYFNIPVDAEYDTDAETIKIFLNSPIMDFTPMVKYIYGYMAIAAGIPLVTRVEFPINKAKLTLDAVVRENNTLQVKTAGNKTVATGKGNRQIGSGGDPIEHKINFSLNVKND